jgi:GNAT superfamily N-acetyltransferase
MKARQAGPADLADIMRLYRQLNPDDPKIEDGSDRKVFDHILHTDGLHIFVLENNGCIEATCYVNIIPNLTRGVAPYAVIENVVTESAQRGKGLGTYLIRHVLDFVWRRNCYKAMLQTGSPKPSVHAFYRSCGFRQTGRYAFVVYANDPTQPG